MSNCEVISLRYIHPELKKNEYLSALQNRMDSHFQFFQKRCTGFFIGSAFMVTYHSGRTKGRKYKSIIFRNTAIGIARNYGESTEIRYLLINGKLAPQYFISTFILFVYICLNIMASYSFSIPVSARWLGACLASLGLTIFITGIDALQVLLYEKGHKGKQILLNILQNPNSDTLD